MFKSKKLLKNYIILLGICLLTVFLVMYIAEWYKVYSDYQKETPVIRGTLKKEITAADFDFFLMEYPTSTIYMCTSKSDNCRNFEKDFKKIVIQKELQDSIIYLNLSNADIESFINDFNNKYNYKIKLNENYPALVEFNDGKITSLLEGEDNMPLTISKARSFIELNHIGE